MRKIGTLTTLLVIALSSALIWISCKSNSKAECFTCRNTLPQSKKDIKIENTSFSIAVYKKTSIPNLSLARVAEETTEVSELMKQVVRNLGTANEFDKLLADGYIPINYSLYFKNDLKSLTEVTKEAMKAISITLYKNAGLHHFLFTKIDDNTFKIDPKYSAATDDLYLMDRYLIFQTAVSKPGDAQLYSLISMVTPDLPKVKPNVKTHNDLRSILKSMASVSARGLMDRWCDPEVCTPIQDSPGECVEVILGMGCKETRDDNCVIKEDSENLGKEAEYQGMANTFYTMRDSILDNSTNGQAIVANYYTAGHYIVPNFYKIDCGRLWGFVQTLHSKCAYLLANPNSSTVLLDETTATDALDMLDDIRGISNAQEWLDCVDWMEDRINQFANQPTSDVTYYITH